METNWIILALILVCAVALILLLVVRDQKDKKEAITSLDKEENIEDESEREKEIE